MAGGPSASKDGGFNGRAGLITYFLTAFAAFAGFLFGYDTGTIKSVTPLRFGRETS
jgi:hypothetical protein